jgi:hypothetical protein
LFKGIKCDTAENDPKLIDQCLASYIMSKDVRLQMSALRGDKWNRAIPLKKPKWEEHLKTDKMYASLKYNEPAEAGKETLANRKIVGVILTENKPLTEPKCVLIFESENPSQPIPFKAEKFISIGSSHLCSTQSSLTTKQKDPKNIHRTNAPVYWEEYRGNKIKVICYFMDGETEIKLSRALDRANLGGEAHKHTFCKSIHGCYHRSEPPSNLQEICDGLLQIYIASK